MIGGFFNNPLRWYHLESRSREKTMRFSNIPKKYRNQWVLVECSKLDKDLGVKGGMVIAHAPTKEEINKV